MVKRIKNLKQKKNENKNLKTWEKLTKQEKDEILKQIAKKLGLVS